MKVEWNKNKAIVRQEDGDKAIYKDSTWWYHLVQVLREAGHDVIRKDPSKDTKFFHMTSMDYYIRSRKPVKGKDSLWLYYPRYAIEAPVKVYRFQGEVTLFVEYKIFDKENEE